MEAMADISRDFQWRSHLRLLLEHRATQKVIVLLIVLNAITLGLETSATAMELAGGLLETLDRIILSVFVIELSIKILLYGRQFPRDPWNIFDFLVVGIALMPATGHLSVFRALRILRVLRLISAVPSMRRVVNALLNALPGMGSIVALLSLIYYVFSVMATKLFGASFPEWFGTIGTSAYTLFQVMTLDSWSSGVVRSIMELYPLAWLFFVPFILTTSFTVLNLFIGIIVDAMQAGAQEEIHAERERAQADAELILKEIQALRQEIAELKARRSP